MPDGDVLIKWGADFRPVTLDGGQWWRLFTSTFIHAGYLHLLINLYALLFIGSLLEPILGSLRYALFYILTGMLASLANVRLNETLICFGATGAIFGLYGIFLALLTTRMIEKKARVALLTSIGLYVAYNLAAGIQGHTFNAAMIGGLAAGILFGYCAISSLREEDELEQGVKLLRNLALSTGITILAILIVYKTVDKKYLLLDERMKRFYRYEMNAINLGNYNFSPIISGTNDFQDSLINMSLANWRRCDRILDSINHMDLPPALKSRNNLIMRYVSLRKEILELTKDGLQKGYIPQNKLDEKMVLLQAQMKDIKGEQF